MDAINNNLPVFPDTEPEPDEMLVLLMRVMRGVNGQAFRLFGNRVHTGPFAGMIIPERTPHWDDGNSGTKLLGSYEFELHDAITHAIWRRPKTVINVGCGEGYYAIGLARHLPNSKVIAADLSDDALKLCNEYAKLNSVENIITAKGVYSPIDLRLANLDYPGHRLYVIDVEGAELDLIDPVQCPELDNSDIIVECHDFMRPDAGVILADQLSATHHVDVIRPRLPDLNQFQFIRTFPTIMSVMMAVEKRPTPCYWLAAWANRKG